MKGPVLARLTLARGERDFGGELPSEKPGKPGVPPPVDIAETGQLSEAAVLPPLLQQESLSFIYDAFVKHLQYATPRPSQALPTSAPSHSP